MRSEPLSRTAIVNFGSARQAGRRVAGVAAAARIVREAAAAGIAEVWLILPPGPALGSGAIDDVRRLARDIRGTVTDERPAWLDQGKEPVLRLPGDRLIPAEALSVWAAGGPEPADSEGLRLDVRGATAELLRQTGKPSDGPVSRWLNRPISRRISAMLLRVPGFRPIHATIGTASLAALMFVLLVGGGVQGLIAAALLFQAASIFDGVDGEVARATYRTSRSGAVLDNAVDLATNILFILGVTVNLGLRDQQPAWLLGASGLGLFGLGLASMTWRTARLPGAFSLNLVKDLYRRRFPGPLAQRLIAFASSVSSRDFFALLFAALIVAGFPLAVLWLFTATATVWIAFVLGSIRWPHASPVAQGG